MLLLLLLNVTNTYSIYLRLDIKNNSKLQFYHFYFYIIFLPLLIVNFTTITL